MNAERWHEVKSVLEAALGMDSQTRRDYLDQVCSSDQSLRREVQSLLDADELARSSFLGSHPLSIRLEKGAHLADYEIQAPLGSGGMGEVYRARDLRLRRDVAIKVLPAFVSFDPERLRRFEQEAQAAAALNHPNILAVFQMGTYAGAPYLVSELLEGETLRGQIARGPITVHKAIDYGVQIAHGLVAAHEKGIVHRDLKPENLFATKDGRIKILDFGLAKLKQPEKSHQGSELTAGGIITEPGMVMGTAGYMSPEQVRGRELDHRTDIFAFGAILYELLTGNRAFHKTTSADTMSAILNEEPTPLSAVGVNIPPALQRTAHRCLEKSPEQRFQSASDLAFALEALSDSTASPAPGIARPGKPIWRPILLSATIVAVLAVAMYWQTRPLAAPSVTDYTQITNDGSSKHTLFFFDFGSSSLRSDGARLYFNRILGAAPFVLAQVSTQGGETVDVPVPFPPFLADISPNHTQLLLIDMSSAALDHPVWVLPALGGSLQRVGELLGHDATWSIDGQRIVYANGQDLFVVPAHGGEPQKIAALPGPAMHIHYSPDGSRLRLTINDPKGHSSSLWEAFADGSNLHPVLPGWNNPHAECCGNWTPDGKYFVFQATRAGRTGVYAMAEGGRSFHKAAKEPVLLTVGPLNYYSPVPSLDGKRIYVVGSQPRGELQRYDMKKRQLVPFLPGLSVEGLDFSGDGRWLTYVTFPEGSLWRSKADGSERMQLTFPPLSVFLPRWSPNGKNIAFAGAVPGRPHSIYLISADGGSPQQLTSGEHNEGDVGWSADGNRLIFGPMEDISTFGIHLLDLKTHQLSSLPDSRGLYSPRWSPDGNYISALTTQNNLVLFDFRTERWVNLPKLPCGFPSWSRDSQSLYFETGVNNPAAFYRVHVSDHRVERLLDMSNLHLTGTYGWTGLAADDSPLFLRDTGREEIYALDWRAP